MSNVTFDMKNLRIYQLIHRDLTGQLSHSDKRELDTYKSNSEYAFIFDELSTVWSASQHYFPQQRFDVEAAKKRFNDRLAADTKPAAKIIPMQWYAIAAAAAVVLLMITWWSLSNSANGDTTIRAAGNIEYAVLPDQSEVWLKQGAELTYQAFETGAARNVSLEGEAYFKVENQGSTPFIIDAGNNNYIEVIGTAFNVHAMRKQGRVDVQVNEGVVRLYNTVKSDLSVLLGAAESAVLDVEMETLVPKTLSAPESFFSDELNFKNAPLPVVLDKLESFFKVKITYDKAALAGCLVNSPLMDDFGLDEIFDVLKGLFPGLTIKQAGDKTFKVGGRGCAG